MDHRMQEALANHVGEYRVTWQKNLRAVKQRGEDPSANGSVKESFAHYSAALNMLIFALNLLPGSNQRTAANKATKMIGDSHAWQAYETRTKVAS